MAWVACLSSGGLFLGRPQMRRQRAFGDDARDRLILRELMHALAFDREELLSFLHQDGVDLSHHVQQMIEPRNVLVGFLLLRVA
jgi:hypothetical protein